MNNAFLIRTSARRPGAATRFAGIIVAAALLATTTPAATAQLPDVPQPPTTMQAAALDPRWLPWIGCWTPSGASEDAAPGVAGVQRTCVAPAADGAGVDLINIRGGSITDRIGIDAAGAQRPVTREGCTGWESARWSEDAERLFLRSELVCSGTVTRTSSGIIAVASASDWVDVQVVRVGDQRSTRVLRYRSVVDTTALGLAIAAAVRDRELARQTARLAAASTPTIADVIEASRHVDASVVEAWLLQRMPRMTVAAASLRQLADAKVASSVIDLVVALAEPDRFGHRLATRGYTFMRIDPPRPTTVAVTQPPQPAVQYPEAPGVTIDIRRGERYEESSTHRHYDGCGHYGAVHFGGYIIAPYAFYPYWPYGDPRYDRYRSGYGDGYGYYPYEVYDPYRPAPARPVAPRGQSRGPDFPDRRPVPATPAPTPDPAPQPEGGRVVKGKGYTRPAGEATNVPAAAPAPAPASGSRGQAAPTRARPVPPATPETKPSPPAEPSRTAKRRPPIA